MKAVKIQNRNIIPSGTTDGCVTLNGDKHRASRYPYEFPSFGFAVYTNGKQTSVERSRRTAIKRCNELSNPDTITYIRVGSKLVYFLEHGHEPVFFRGFQTDSWKNKSFRKAFVDYDNHTPKETTERYDAITFALEQIANQNETQIKP